MSCKLFPLVFLTAATSVLAQGHLAWYRSPVDGTRQAYGIYLPRSPAPPRGYPAIFHGHGYGWSVSAGFSAWQRRWADEHGWVLININARGPTFYEGIGQQAVYEVVADACRRFGLDRRRLFFTGGSMGGSGAVREGVRHPELFAAAAPVDGWTDWRLWHHHWYARTDMRDDIEEFRRPLLASVAPLYWAERALWGRLHIIVDGKDTIVWPDNGLGLAARMRELSGGDLSRYRTDTVLNRDRGHGGGYDLRALYDFFLRCAPAGLGHSLRLACWRLAYARQGWISVEEIHHRGQKAEVSSLVAEHRISVWATNVSRVAVYPAVAPDFAPADPCQVYVDGWPVYSGPLRRIVAEAVYDAADEPVLWRLAEDSDDGTPRLGRPPTPRADPPASASQAAWPAGATSGTEAPPALPCAERALRKRPGLEGPLGDAFVQPFKVFYATHGPPEHVARHREEAEAFARGWTNFFVHGPGIVAGPEDECTKDIFRTRNVVLFGCLDCSRLLQVIERTYPLPVKVYHEGVVVQQGPGRQRCYMGPQFGAFFLYPNPLAGFQHYLVVCSGRWNTKPDRYVPAGLEYDLEKLPWAYPDYLVFNNDQKQLPFVLNVNNKPPVTCYEAAYFVEAGYFDNRWRPDRDQVVRWVKATKPERARLIHVDEEQPGDPLRLRVVDSAGVPVKAARVTVGDGIMARSSVTDGNGWASFPGLPAPSRTRLLNVMATGCAYDEAANCPAAQPSWNRVGRYLAVRFTGPKRAPLGTQRVTLSWEIANLAPCPVHVTITGEVSRGHIVAPTRSLTIPPRSRRKLEEEVVECCSLAGPVSVALEVHLCAGAATVWARICDEMEVCDPAPATVLLSDPKASREGTDWVVSARVSNLLSAPVIAVVRAVVVEAAWRCDDQRVVLEPQGGSLVAFHVPVRAGLWHQGKARVVITVAGQPCSTTAEVVLPYPGGETLASRPRP